MNKPWAKPGTLRASLAASRRHDVYLFATRVDYISKALPKQLHYEIVCATRGSRGLDSNGILTSSDAPLSVRMGLSSFGGDMRSNSLYA